MLSNSNLALASRGSITQKTKHGNWRTVTVFASSEYPKASIVNARTGQVMHGKVGNRADERQYCKVRIATGIPLGNANGSKTLFFETPADYADMILVQENDDDDFF